MDCKYLDESGRQQSPIMGCYGIGVGRLMASVIEEHSDDWGPIWTKNIAPFQELILNINKNAEAMEAAEKIYRELIVKGVEVLFDDRAERPGVKFKDADLWGIPVRIAVGGKNLVQNQAEWKLRSEKDFELVDLDKIVEKTINWLNS